MRRAISERSPAARSAPLSAAATGEGGASVALPSGADPAAAPAPQTAGADAGSGARVAPPPETAPATQVAEPAPASERPATRRAPPALDPPGPGARPVLPRGVRIARDEVRGQWVLLAPERALRLDDTGLAVLREIDGRRTVAEIAAVLADRYGAPPEVVLKDATAFLSGLWARRIADLAEDA